MVEAKQTHFISLRWWLGLPLAVLLLVALMLAVYLLAGGSGGDVERWQANVLGEASRTIARSASTAETLAGLQPSAMTELALYDAAGRLLQTTLPVNELARADLALLPADVPPGLQGQTEPRRLMIDGTAYLVVYAPFSLGSGAGGVLAVMMQAGEGGGLAGQVAGLLLAGVAGGLVIGLFILVRSLIGRIQTVTQTAESLAAGHMTSRTGMQPIDEVGRLGQALDRYADSVRQRQDLLRADLRRQRREITYLVSVLESLPDGVIVLDMDGHVMLMNEPAREMMGSHSEIIERDMQSITAMVTDMLGPSIAPGIYALGSPHQFDVRGRIMSAQAAAVMTPTQQRVGTVVILRDITEEVRRARLREQILAKMAQEAQQPLVGMDTPRRADTSLSDFAREMNRHTLALQRLVLEMRELTDPNVSALPDHTQQPIPLDTLIWSVANEWRQIAHANNLKLHVIIEKGGLQVVGSERRLRWALGNLVDNAIKYTPPGGDLTLEIRADNGSDQAHLRIRDNGVGIAQAELPYIFQRFYRGRPVTPEGRVIRVPGTGQGLTTARQIITAHGGTLIIKSRQGLGTAAYITLPLTAGVQMSLPRMTDELDGETMQLDMRSIQGRKRL